MSQDCELRAICLAALISLLIGPVELAIVSCPLNARRYEEKERILAIENYPFGNIDSGTFEGVLTAVPRLESVIMRNTSVGKVADGTFLSLAQLKCLDLSNNDLCNLTPNAFAGLSSLETLILAHNHIETIPEGLFEALPNLLLLDLGHNRLTSLTPKVFSGLTKLEELHLQFNNITDVPSGVFVHLKNLRRLFLHRNPLLSVDLSLGGLSYLNTLVLSYTQLSRMPFVPDSVEILDLEGAQLTTLSAADSSRLERLNHLWLARNPWQCDCRLMWFPKWTVEKMSTILLDHNALKCENPSDLYALNITEAMKELNCREELPTTTELTTTWLTTTTEETTSTAPATSTSTTTETTTPTTTTTTPTTTTSTSSTSTKTFTTTTSKTSSTTTTTSSTSTTTTTTTPTVETTTITTAEPTSSTDLPTTTSADEQPSSFESPLIVYNQSEKIINRTTSTETFTKASEKSIPLLTTEPFVPIIFYPKSLATSTSTTVEPTTSREIDTPMVFGETNFAGDPSLENTLPTEETHLTMPPASNSSHRFDDLMASLLQTLSSLRSTETPTRLFTQNHLASVHDWVDKKSTGVDHSSPQTSISAGDSTMSSVELLGKSGTVAISLDLLPLGVKAALLWVGGGVATSLILFGLYVLARKLMAKRRQSQMLRLRKFYSPEALQMPSVEDFQPNVTTSSRYSRSGTSSLTGTVHPRTKSALLSYSQSQMDPNPFADHTVYSRVLPTLLESSSRDRDSLRGTTSVQRHV